MALAPTAPTLRTEHDDHSPRIGSGSARPRLSWTIETAPPAYAQAAYELRWTTTDPSGTVIERSDATVESTDQILVPWPGRPLGPRQCAEVSVRTKDGSSGEWGRWSAPVSVERGLAAEDWRAQLIGPGYPEGPETDRRAPLVRYGFVVTGDVRAARLHVTAHGLVETELNGIRVGRDELLPGWTPYGELLRVFTYDVTDLIRAGENAIGAWLADGWFRGRFGFEGGTTDIYGSHVGVLAQLEIVLADGTTQTVASDDSWRSAPGPLTRASLYDGERIDLNLVPAGWSEPGFDDAEWAPVVVHPLDLATLAAHDGPAVRVIEEIAPISITAVDDGWLIDYGQNHSGRPRVRVPAAPAGTHITIRHAEVLQDGRLCTRPLRAAAATDEIITAGEPVEWEPRFTIHGYRYAFVTGWPGDRAPSTEEIVSRVMHSDMPRTGWFRSDRDDLNRLHENVVWGLRSNFVDIPTDCPQRDERLGWTGDIQIFTPTASFLYDVHDVLGGWLRALVIEQDRFDGNVPVYVPFIPGGPWWNPREAVAGWGDAAVLVPEALHDAFADRALVERQFASARTWVEKVCALAGPGRLWDQQRQLGDWLDPTAPPDRPFEAKTDPHLVSTAYFARSTAGLARLAGLLGKSDDAVHYGALATEIRGAFANAYLESGVASHDTVTAHSLAIVFGLHPDDESRQRAGDRLAVLVRAHGHRVATGFLGTPVVAEALTATGHTDTAYALVLNHDAPSWMATVDLGATTVWERWDSLLPDGTVNPGDMTSFNHYALGSVAHWIHGTIGGLSTVEPGWRRIRIAPRPGPGVTSAMASHMSPYGMASVDWAVHDGDLRVSFTIPVGATAVVDLPGTDPYTVGHGIHTAVSRL
ncbi:glycoside hydrolase family 78 protein [Microbacterium hominis]|uniref:alpha-L-rhamnosidase n=1 Tax=Microbacterium hominis TaxID=162426 RepID=A0A7D4Q4P6_9MICO|nr:glycoside hydrolase family 78 protein [Microbacterium hominis]QKJ20791.1 family 78 glycoside hydrolase catalytic domain [Microbacterium hominis]